MLKKFTAQSAMLTVLFAGALTSAGCNREQPAPPVAEVQTQTPAQPANQPLTIAGCLRAGEASDTFVLTVSQQTASPDQAATYQLAPAANVDLRGSIGQRVEVTGVVRAQQTAETRTATTPAAGESATGTAGTKPTVQTATAVDIKQLDVNAMKPLGERCDR